MISQQKKKVNIPPALSHSDNGLCIKIIRIILYTEYFLYIYSNPITCLT
jgi:hypothetical protein